MPAIPWEKWIIDISAGPTTWKSSDNDATTLPNCVVGDWDNGGFWDWLDSVLAGPQVHPV